MCVTGKNKSKFENYFVRRLSKFYPNLDINLNDRDILSGFELDIYIPSLKIAIEVNGPHHYIPKYGERKFQKTRYNDRKKSELCKEKNIKLMIMDISRVSLRDKMTLNMMFDMIFQEINSRRK